MGVFLSAGIFIIITAIILIVNTMQRVQEFKDHQTDIQETLVHGASYAINLQLQNKRRHVALFIEEYSSQINHLTRFPDDEKTRADLESRLKQRFPDFYTYTITRQSGEPIFDDIDSLVGDACRLNLERFSKKFVDNKRKPINSIFIHPQPYRYHYDVMAHLHVRDGVNNQVFFSSFFLQEIADILKTHGVLGQELMLVRQSEPDLIEVTKQGARDKLSREIRLTDEEQRLIKFYTNVPETDWQLISLPDVGFVQDYQRGLWKEATILFIIIGLALLLMMFVLINYLGKKK